MTRCSSIKHQAHVLQRCPRGQESWSKQTNCQEGASKRLPKPKAISERCPDIYNKMARKNTIKTISRCVKRFNMCQDMSRQWWLLWLRWNLGNHTSRWLWMLATPCLGDAQWLWRIATAVKSTQRTANSMVPIRRAFFAGLIFHNICRVLSNVRHLSHTGTSEKSCAKVQSLSHMPFSARGCLSPATWKGLRVGWRCNDSSSWWSGLARYPKYRRRPKGHGIGLRKDHGSLNAKAQGSSTGRLRCKKISTSCCDGKLGNFSQL